ncbi:MAG: ABC transporter ATP-binding protein [Actinomycetota bacterium]
MSTAPPLLEMRGITKRFPGVLANDAVDLDVRRGEVHALLGENGAGKSTLMKILFGLYAPDEGEVLLDGRPLAITSPAAAIEAGIGMIHQHFMLVNTLTVTENVALGLRDLGQVPTLDAVSARVEELAGAYGLDVDPHAYVWQLSVGERQRVEILKALYREARLLVLDEPTAVLTPQEVESFFVTLRKLAEDGRGLIFISHKLHEVLALADRITVLRDGAVSGATVPEDATRERLAEMMVGREVRLAPDKPALERGAVRLRIADLRVMGDRGTEAVAGLDLEVAAGEIVGVAGVSGNGQRELAEAIAGLRAVSGGTVEIDGAPVVGLAPSEVRRAGLGYVPEERMRDGAIGEFSVTENLMLIDHAEPEHARRGFLRLGPLRERASSLVERYAVKTPSTETSVKSLSGGNIQKLIMAREITAEPGVLVVAQPTRGVDIGAAEYIHERLIEQRSGDTAILVISEDLDEVLGLADRVAVMYAGRIVAVIDREDCTVEELGLLMAGG